MFRENKKEAKKKTKKKSKKKKKTEHTIISSHLKKLRHQNIHVMLSYANNHNEKQIKK